MRKQGYLCAALVALCCLAGCYTAPAVPSATTYVTPGANTAPIQPALPPTATAPYVVPNVSNGISPTTTDGALGNNLGRWGGGRTPVPPGKMAGSMSQKSSVYLNAGDSVLLGYRKH